MLLIINDYALEVFKTIAANISSRTRYAVPVDAFPDLLPAMWGNGKGCQSRKGGFREQLRGWRPSTLETSREKEQNTVQKEP